MIFKHRTQLSRRSRHQHDMMPANGKDHSRSRAIFVFKHLTSFRHLRLLPVIVRDLHSSFFEIARDPLTRVFICHKRNTQCFCNGFLCQIILCWSKSSRYQNNVRTPDSSFHRLCKACLIITDHTLIVAG